MGKRMGPSSETPYPNNYEMDNLSDFNFGAEATANTLIRDDSSSHYDMVLVGDTRTAALNAQAPHPYKSNPLPPTPVEIARANLVQLAAHSYNRHVPLPPPPGGDAVGVRRAPLHPLAQVATAADADDEQGFSRTPANPYDNYYRGGTALGMSRIKYSAAPTYDPDQAYNPANSPFRDQPPLDDLDAPPRFQRANLGLTRQGAAAGVAAAAGAASSPRGGAVPADQAGTISLEGVSVNATAPLPMKGGGYRYDEVELDPYRNIAAVDRTLPPVPQENPFEMEPMAPSSPHFPSDDDHSDDKHYDELEARRLRRMERNRIKNLRRKPRFHYTRLPYFTMVVTLIQVIVFIVELGKMALLTGLAFQSKPYFNPMLGPLTYLLINMGARYIPCMHTVADVTTDLSLNFPCPNSTSIDTNVCLLPELCGLLGIPVDGSAYAPNQWYRIFIPMFLHAGFLHILFNLLLQLSMGALMERHIGSLKYAIIYVALGIAGFLLGANFTPVGIALTGALGALFGIVAANIVQFIYMGRKNTNMYGTKHFWLFLVIMVFEILVLFVLGLLPGMDNFSHLGGFAMGLVLSVLLLQDPFWVYRDGIILYTAHETTWQQFKDNWNPRLHLGDKDPRKYWGWCAARVVALVLAVVYFAMLAKTFFTDGEDATTLGCKWCKYFNCLPVNGWCDIGDITFTDSDSGNTDDNVSSTPTATTSAPASTTEKSTPTKTTTLPPAIENGAVNNPGGLGQRDFSAFETSTVQATIPPDPMFTEHANIGMGFYVLTAILSFGFLRRKNIL